MLAQLTFKRLLSNNKLFLVYKNIIKTKFVYIFLFISFIYSFIHSSIRIYHDYGSIGFKSLELFKMASALSSHFFKSWSCRAAHFLHKIWVHGMCKIINYRFKIFHWIWLNSKYMVHGVTPGLFGGQGVFVLLEILKEVKIQLRYVTSGPIWHEVYLMSCSYSF